MKQPASPLPPHPSSDDLIAFARGSLDSVRMIAVEKHVELCAPCAAGVAAAPDDAFIGLLKAAGHSDFAKGMHDASDQMTEAFPRTRDFDLHRLPPELREHPRYKIEDLLAAGAMGEVYRATDTSTSQCVAVKVLKPQLAGNPARKKRFLQEARIAASLRSSHIVRILHYAPAGETCYIAMEFVAGETLSQIVSRRGPLPAAEACTYVRQVAMGLAYADRQGVVHRDIKPDNLIVDAQSQVVKILDFGLGRLVDEQRTGTRLTGEGEILGTVDYMSPEQVSDARTADIRSDIYSLGCVLFFLLSGSPPFCGRNPLEVLDKHREEPPPSLRIIRPDVPVAIALLLERMLSKDPAQRPKSPDEIVAALTSDEPPATGNADPVNRPSPIADRPRRLSAAGLVPLLLSPAVMLPAATLAACLLWYLRK